MRDYYSLIAPDVTTAMLVERLLMEEKSYRKFFYSIIMQNLSEILLLFWHQHGHLITRVQSKNGMLLANAIQ